MAKSITPATGRESAHTPSLARGYNPISRFHDEMDRLFDQFFGGINLPSWAGGAGKEAFGGNGFLTPAIDVSETDKEYCVEADLPGLDEKEVSLTLQDGVLVLKGEKKEEKEESKKDYRISERRWGSFQRALPIPSDVDENHVSAEFKKGVLTVHLPKSAEAQKSAKQIQIKAG